MSLGIIGVSSNIISPKKNEQPNHWWTPSKNPNDILKEQSDKFIRQHEEESKAKPANERNVGDWINVASSYVRKFVEFGEQTKKY